MFGHYPQIRKFLGTRFYRSQYILPSVEELLFTSGQYKGKSI